MTESQHRFLKAIAERVTRGRIAEVRVFPTVRSGQVDSGVAIVAVEDLEVSVPSVVEVDVETGAVAEAGPDAEPGGHVDPAVDAGFARLSILTARFRHTVKGPDRGKWEFEIVHDADAPQAAIESVVRGVASRSGEDGEPDLLSGDDFQRVLSRALVDGAGVAEAFRAYLREHNLPVTRQRALIAAVVLESGRHLSAEDVADELHRRGGAAGLATVYRTLDLLVRSGLAVERDFGEGFRRYEAARDIPHHEHLLCTRCGRVTEFRDERLERITTLVAETRGYLRQRHRLVIYGVCEACRTGAAPN